MGNNIAMPSAGYKKDYLVTTTFGEHLEMQNGVNVGNVNFGTRADATYTSFEQEPRFLQDVRWTFYQRRGFFNIIMPDRTVRLTRNGQFSLNQDGF